MAAKKKPAVKKPVSKTTKSKGKSTANTAAKRKNVEAGQNNSQFWSVLLFSLGILVAMITLIEGSALWKVIHNTMLGLFGISVFLVAPMIIYVAVMIALDKSNSAVWAKVIQGAVLMFLVSAIVQLFIVGDFDGDGLIDKLLILFKEGTRFRGGGLLSAFLAYPLYVAFNRVGAAIIVVLFTFTFFMLLTDISLLSLFGFIAKPVKKSAQVMREANEERYIKKEEKQAEKNTRIDIAKYIDDDNKSDEQNNQQNDEQNKENDELPMHPVVSSKGSKKSKSDLDDPTELVDLIQKAVPVSDVNDNNNEKEIDNKEGNTEEKVNQNELFVGADGQTSMISDNTTQKLYKLPPITLLNPTEASKVNFETQNELKQNAEVLVDTLKSFGVQTRIVGIHRGPSVTRYELQPAAGVKVSRITSLTDDIKMSLAAKSIRIEAPIPGKAAVGIEVPNNQVDIITMREMLETKEFSGANSKIAFALGKDITGEVVFADIAKMPHVLIAGATGSGKSVCINSIIISLLYKSSPEDVRLLMIDPKMVELEVYNGIPHLLIPVVTDPRKAAGALSWAVTEMQKRYKIFADNNVRNLTGYNELAATREDMNPLPQIVIIIDELADLMMVAAKDVEEAICRLAQLARAAGMHLVIATQRPSVDIITGVIKANIPSRIAFAVSSQIDSRTILDSGGAEKLLGRGDMLFSAYGAPKPTRLQGCFVTDKEVETVVGFIKDEIKADYDEQIIDEIEKNAPVAKDDKSSSGGTIDSSDEMVEKAIEILVEAGQASTSYLQRRLKLGYARAARIIDELEEMGIVGPSEGAKPRAVLMTKEQWYEAQVKKQE